MRVAAGQTGQADHFAGGLRGGGHVRVRELRVGSFGQANAPVALQVVIVILVAAVVVVVVVFRFALVVGVVDNVDLIAGGAKRARLRRRRLHHQERRRRRRLWPLVGASSKCVQRARLERVGQLADGDRVAARGLLLVVLGSRAASVRLSLRLVLIGRCRGCRRCRRRQRGRCDQLAVIVVVVVGV